MKEIITIKALTWKGVPGHSIVEVTDYPPNDPSNFKMVNGKQTVQGQSIKDLKARFNGTKGSFLDPFSKEHFEFDLTPWLHLNEESRLHFSWKFKPEHPIPPTDPRYPHPSQPLS